MNGARRGFSLMFASALLSVVAVPVARAQVTRADVLFGGLSARTAQLAYQQRGGDMKPIEPLMAEAANPATDPVTAYRDWTHAILLMNGTGWTPATELRTAIDFSIQPKVLGTNEYLQSRATFLFDAPPVADPPYRLELDILKSDGTNEASVESGIVLGDVRGRRGGETIGRTFDPSKLVGPGLHMLRATLKDGHGVTSYQYYRTFAIVPDLTKRLDTLEKTLELLPDQKSTAALTARWVMERVKLARHTYLGGNFQNLVGYLYGSYRVVGLGLGEAMDFDSELERASKLATALQEGRDPLEGAKGDLHLAYRSTFDGSLVPYRIYLPSKYEKSEKYPLIMLLHGAGGDENDFFDRYSKLWPKLAEQHGCILAAVNGRGPVSFYAKQNGGEQDVLRVLDLVEKNYSIDSTREYLAGHSMGGLGTWTIGLEYRDRFAALGPIAGTRDSPALETALASSGRKLPIFIICGGQDALIPATGCRPVAEKAKSLGYSIKYEEYRNEGHLSVAVVSVPALFDWFVSQHMEVRH